MKTRACRRYRLTAMPILSPAKALRTLRKTPIILQAVLSGIDEREAVARTDGPGGWSILFIACHLRDYEVACIERVTDMLANDHPAFDVWDNDDLAKRHAYAEQQFDEVMADLTSRRKVLIKSLENLEEVQWARTGVHPIQGEGTVLDVAINAGLHDVDHIEQISRCKNS